MAHLFKKIMVAYDGSAQAEAAFAHALELAARFGADLLILSVIRPAEPAMRVHPDGAVAEARAYFEERFSKLRLEAASKGVSLASEIASGHPAEEIVRAAEREHADLIVMGRRGKSLFERWKLGSISERVLRYAHCPVLAVH
jgi:nucleotide-binding universal stress UspA family protein